MKYKSYHRSADIRKKEEEEIIQRKNCTNLKIDCLKVEQFRIDLSKWFSLNEEVAFAYYVTYPIDERHVDLENNAGLPRVIAANVPNVFCTFFPNFFFFFLPIRFSIFEKLETYIKWRDSTQFSISQPLQSSN